MDEGEIYDAVSDIAFKFSMEFRKYVMDENLICHKFTKYRSDDVDLDAWLFKKEQQSNGVVSDDPYLTNKLLTMFEALRNPPLNCLFQFWRAELSNLNDLGEKRFILTTRNQPFLISGSKHGEKAPIRKGICSYRKKMTDIVEEDGGGGGVIGRVFRTKRMEFTPYIHFYTLEEHPHRDLALSCSIESSLAIPLSDSSGRLVGVLEIVSENKIYHEDYINELQDSCSWRYPQPCKDLCGMFDLEDGSLLMVVSEIEEVLSMIEKSCDLFLYKIWMLCNGCDSLSTYESLCYKHDGSYSNNYDCLILLPGAEFFSTLKKGEGVVGKATVSSHGLAYCEDVSQFSINEYPLAHYARLYVLKSSLAICLKSVLTGSQIYVLELFLHPSNVNGIGLTNTLLQILEVMRENFRTLNLTSGEERGNNLSVQIIDARLPNISQAMTLVGPTSMENHNNAQICNDEQANVVGPSQQPLVQVNVVGNSKKCITNSSNLPFQMGGIDFSFEELEEVFVMKRKDVAQRINVEYLHYKRIGLRGLFLCVYFVVSVSASRRVHRNYNISRWPPRKRKIGLRGLFFCIYFIVRVWRVRRDYSISRWPSRKRKVVHSSRNSVQRGSMKEARISIPAVQTEGLKLIEGEYGDNSSVPVIDFFSPEKNDTLGNTELDFNFTIGMNNTRRPYLLQHSIGETSTEETEDPITGEETSFQDTSMQETRTLFSASTVQSGLRLTVKAKCGDDFIVFQLFSSSGIDELSQHVSQRLNLEFGTYTVKYLDDDNDSVLIVCDEDLHQYISSSVSKGRFTLKMMIEPIKAS